MESSGRTILLAEDNPLDVELTLNALRAHGLTNTGAASTPIGQPATRC
jgi:hypothetical protein